MKTVLVLLWLSCAVSLTSQQELRPGRANLKPGNFVKVNSEYFIEQETLMTLSDYKKCFDLSYDQFVTKNKVEDRDIQTNVSYEKLDSVTRVSLHSGQDFHFRDNRLLLTYVSDEQVVKRLWDEFKKVAGSVSPEKTVRSRAGKTSNQLIFASHGVTVSMNKTEVHFIEIYPPCSVDDYLENIYIEPQPFIR